MQKHIYLFLFLLAGFAPLFAQEDAEGSKDSPLFTRMPGYHIYRYDDLQFDKYEFKISAAKTQVVEGHHLLIYYDLNNNVTPPSPLQVVRNYTNAIKKIGGQLVFEWDDAGENVVLKVAKNGVETWAHIYASGNGSYTIHLIEKQSMNQDVVADANSLMNSIKESGKVAVYGIYFDKFYFLTSSTLRFRAFPSSVSLVATGEVGPSPHAMRREILIEYWDTRTFTTDAALSIESFILESYAPVLSVCPTT